MSKDDAEKNRPSHRVSFSRITGQDDEGNDILGPAREIGSIWPRSGKDGAGILRFDHTPKEPGVFFTREVEAPNEERTDKKRPSRDRER